ncbi:chromate resistance exported protein [Sulfuriferula plumbiphila]|uniref:Chromate resistance exported protein n=1 Tax=Sulfuriferula plumbiphila TaxID=171865 RepID=A0A512L3W1_9PROT|nr:chromate resistance protein ChrB domain-containing protein [Sulfuriferula plumbiphila]BBP05540.1 chromate resistance exported protein [Sulfuriferula plumbiphila]GEP29163.1 chromate resistance exported protein [Sulfuriferula plumbiphila]
MNHNDAWLALITSLPTRNATVRMRIWRALKALGCAVLRDGVYLLPDHLSARPALQAQAAETLAAGGTAQVVGISATDPQQAAAFRALFDRSAEYTQLKNAVDAFIHTLATLDAVAAKRTLGRLRRDFEAIAAIDYFPAAARAQVAAELAQAEAAYQAHINPDEPHAATGSIQRLPNAEYQNRTWATRRQLWVDRMASAWLIHRFIDRQPVFIWLERPQDCPQDALGFDFDGGAFTHVGNRVTFEVLLASFGLEHDPALIRIGALVHYLDVGGIPVAEAAGLEIVLKAMQTRCPDDDALLVEASRLFDDLYAAFTL